MTQILIYSPLEEDFSYETGVETPGGCWRMREGISPG
jgi:hypothetical protein